jgi:hypothetical protein
MLTACPSVGCPMYKDSIDRVVLIYIHFSFIFKLFVFELPAYTHWACILVLQYGYDSMDLYLYLIIFPQMRDQSIIVS